MGRSLIFAVMAGLCATASFTAVRADSTAAAGAFLTDPVWKAAPSSRDLKQFYPDRALNGGVSGFAVVSCTVGAGGALGGCVVWGEDPRGQGFASALLDIAKYMQAAPTSSAGAPTFGRTVRLGAKFSAPTIAGVDDQRVEVVTVQR